MLETLGSSVNLRRLGNAKSQLVVAGGRVCYLQVAIVTTKCQAPRLKIVHVHKMTMKSVRKPHLGEKEMSESMHIASYIASYCCFLDFRDWLRY